MKPVLIELHISERQKTLNVPVNERNAHTMYTTVFLTFPAWNCLANSLSAFTTSHSLISSSILLPGIWTSLCKYHSSFSLWGPAAQTHVLCRYVTNCCKDSNIIGAAQPTEDKISRCLFLPITPRDRIPTAGIREHVWKELTINELDQVKRRGP